MDLNDLPGVGPARMEILHAMGIFSLRDLLYTLPLRYEDHATVYPCSTKTPGMILVSGVIVSAPKLSVFHGLRKVTASLQDDTGKMPLCWYNAPWIMNHIHEGQSVRLFGRLILHQNRRVLQNPQIIDPSEGLIPVYRSCKGLPAKTFRGLIRTALENVNDCCPETLPTSFRLENRLCELNYAIREAHFPDGPAQLAIARRRLSFERVLLYLLYVSSSGLQKRAGPPFHFLPSEEDRFWHSLPFDPTGSQRQVLNVIADDLKKETAMSRLVQGDVGCGKTAVSFGAIWLAYCSGYQSSMMAPTEILARQHYESAEHILAPLGVRCRLLTGSTKPKERKKILAELKDHRCDAVFGTHALISKDVDYAHLGLVITDEQHRFGVNQRSSLQQKGETGAESPHVLVMSATPIPRTLALILYGDLDISVINELPKGRKPVRTRLVPESKREAMYRFLTQEIQKGKQAYIVCPLVEDSEESSELHSAKALYARLSSGELKGFRLGLTWGEQKPEEKEKVLHGFADGTYDILVSTTVIEVGVNNPNATIMIIENADRFGLSQLHQLRGRVGRGQDESWCFLLADSTEKLSVLCSTNDGFVISRKDLELRGPGDLIGTQQSGEIGSAYLPGDVRLLDEVSRCVQRLHRDPAQQTVLEELEQYAKRYFAERGRSIALN